jgi:protein-disulfide isomerase
LESKDKPCSTIVKDIATRYEFFKDTVRYPIDYSGVAFEGAPDAPVKIVMYVSLSCPLCKRVYHDLTDSLKVGDRSKKIAVCVKPFSQSQLEHALVATQKWNKQSEFLRTIAQVNDRITMEIVTLTIEKLKIPLAAFNEEINAKKTLTRVEASRAEALNNGVTSTPTIFINGKKYTGSKNAQWVIDAAEYELLKR